MTIPVGASGSPVDMAAPDVSYSLERPAPRPLVALSLPTLSLSLDEQGLVAGLEQQITGGRFHLELRDAYYRGTVRIQQLGISIPPQLSKLHTALGWPRVGVDALDERLDVEGFRYPNSTDVDEDLQELWQHSDMAGESQLGHMDALIFGRGFAAVGTGDDGLPLITVESPLDMAAQWDARSKRMSAALRLHGDSQSLQGTLYLPDQTVYLTKGDGGWDVEDRDEHRIGRVLVERIANRARSYDRNGSSEITPEVMSITDAACRTLLGLEVAREFYSAPQRYILGASESAFQDAEGNPKGAWETYLGRVLALERDEEGNVPTVGQFTPYDPATYTKVIDMYAKIMSSITGLPPHVLGYTTDNPASADAIRSSENRLVKKADRKTRMFGESWRNVMQLALLVRDGSLPDKANAIQTVWASTATPTPGATTDSVFKQVQMGYLPATSDVTGEKLGYSATERARIEIDRQADAGNSFLQEIAHNLQAKAARVDTGLTNSLKPEPGTTGTTSGDAAPTQP